MDKQKDTFEGVFSAFFSDVFEDYPSIATKYERGLLTRNEALLAYVDKARDVLIAERETTAIYYYLLYRGFSDEKARAHSVVLQRTYKDVEGVISALQLERL